MIHGHYQCAECGKIQDGDCCQGETGAKERDNKYKVIEINPRMWGSVLLSEFCGTNFLQKYIDLILGKIEIENRPIKDCSIRWQFPYDIIYFIKHLTNPFRFFNSPKNTCHINFTYFFFF